MRPAPAEVCFCFSGASKACTPGTPATLLACWSWSVLAVFSAKSFFSQLARWPPATEVTAAATVWRVAEC